MRKYAIKIWWKGLGTTPGRVVIEADNGYAAMHQVYTTMPDVKRAEEDDLVTDTELWKPVKRISGDAKCQHCGFAIDHHQQPIKATAPTVVVDCAGDWWKV